MIITFLIEGPIVGFLPKLAYVEGENREGVEEVKNSLLPPFSLPLCLLHLATQAKPNLLTCQLP